MQSLASVLTTQNKRENMPKTGKARSPKKILCKLEEGFCRTTTSPVDEQKTTKG